MRNIIITIFAVFCFPIFTLAQQITKGEYFFDTDPGAGFGTAISLTQGDSVVFTTSVITTGLSVGFHNLFTRYCDAIGKWGLYEGRTIYIKSATTANSAQITTAEAFYDSDPGVGNGMQLSVTTGDSVIANLSVPTTGLTQGFHHLFIRFKDANQKWSLYEGRTIFVKSAAPSSSTQINAAEVFFDTDPGIGLATPIAVTTGDSVVANLNVPTAGISQGFHNLFIRFRDVSNKWSLYEGRTVYVASAIQISATLVKAEAFIDTDPGVGNGFQISFSPADSLTYTSAIPTTSLSQGTHYLYTRVKDANGKWSLYEGLAIIVCNQGPTAGYSFTTSGNQVTFTNSSSTDAYAYNWNFGDGTNSTLVSPTHNYANAGTFNVCLIATSGCGADTVCQTVSFTCTTPTANFTSSVNNLNAAFTNTSVGGSSYAWNFGDGATSTQSNPNHTFQNTGSYNVCLTTTNGCGTNQKCNLVNVTCAAPTALFSRTINGQTVTFTNASSNAASVMWYFGDGQTSTQYNEVHQYATAGSFSVKLKVTNGCGSDSLIFIVDVNCTRPVLAYNYYVDGLTVEFENNTLNGTSYQWSFGDNLSSTLKNPTHIFASTATYNVCLKATNACGADSVCQNISVCTSPVANFSAVINGLNISFSNTSTNATNFVWNYGDGYGTNINTPTHVYSQAGNYNICLTTSNECGTNQNCQNIATTCTPLSNQSICLVTVDTFSTYNVIIWEKPVTTTIDSFRIYRVQTASIDDLIGSVSYNALSEFHDLTCNPNVTQYDYKISVIDSCGIEGPKSPIHRTILMTTSLGFNQCNLQWNQYVGNAVNQYHVWRDDNLNGVWTLLATLSPASTTYIDNNWPTSAGWRYRIDVDWVTSCTPTARTTAAATNTTRSNTRDNYRLVGLSQLDANSVTLFPNPANELVNVNLNTNAYINNINVIDATGRLVKTISSTNKNNQAQINTSDLARGIYFIEVNTNAGIVRKSFVRE